MKHDFFSNQLLNSPLSWRKRISQWAWQPLQNRPLQGLLLFAIALPVLYLASKPDANGHSGALSVILPVLILWAGFRLGSAVAALLVIIAAFLISLSPGHHPDMAYTLFGFALLGQTVSALVYSRNKAEEALKAHNKKLELSAQALNSISQAVLITSKDRKIIYANPAFEKITGRSEDELIGKTCLFMQGAESDPLVISEMRIALENARPFYGEIINYRKDGSPYWNEISIIPILDEHSNVSHFVSAQRDITERKNVGIKMINAAEETRLLLEKLQKLTANVPGMIYQFKLEKSGKSYFPYCSEGVRKTFMLTPEEIQQDASALFSRLHPDDMQKVNQSILISAQSGEPWQQESRVVLPDQSVHWMLGHALPEIQEDSSVLWHGFISDITEIKNKELVLQEQDSKLNSILNSAGDGIILIDTKGIITLFNPAAEKIFGYQKEEVLNKNIKMLMHEPEHSQHDQYLSQYLLTRKAKTIGIGREVSGRHKNGQSVPLDLSVSEWKSGNETMYTGLVRDISERKLIQAQLIQSQKMDALSHLSGGLAHDFNNLLGIIIANLDFIAMETEGNPKALIRCQSALDAALRGADITRRLLKLSRQQPGLPQEIKPQNVGELINGVLALLQRTLGAEITINTFIEPDLPAIKLDTAEFENVLINLAINARDAMPDDGGDIVIYLHHWRPEIFNHAKDIQPDDQHYLLLEFNDNGKGMPAEISERIFEPFFTTKAENGTGLGLAMVYGFIKQLNGHIRVYSEPGVGTMFHLFLPIDPAAKNAADKAISAAEPVMGGSETILLVDDEATLREVTAEHLSSLGYSVIQAENALDAIEKLANAGKIDLLLSDIVMPGGMDGITLAQYISEFSPDMAVLLTSGYPHKNSAADRSTMLFGEILHKPYRRETLMRSVRQRIDEKIAA